METVTNLASAASKAIWGETSTEKADEYETSGTEPVSGQTGDVKSGEPYDKGNLDEATEAATESSSNPTTAAAYPTTDATADAIIADVKPTSIPSEPTTAPAYPTTDATADAIIADTKLAPIESNPTTAPAYPTTDATADAVIADTKASSTEDSTKTELPIRSAPSSTEPTTSSTSADPFSAQKTTKDDGPQKASLGQGTGEKYVETTGVKADGGDFDATKPGAGKEADRLLEQSTPYEAGTTSKKNESSSAVDTTEHKEKKSLKEKIKDKLHIHKEKD